MTEIKNTSVIDFSDISDEQMNAMIDGTLTEFDEGDLVDGTVVKIEHDEVLVDIGFKSEGVIPSRELSIKHDVDPDEIVSVGDEIEALTTLNPLTGEIVSEGPAPHEDASGAGQPA